jgi:hypothetical protein
MTLSIPPFWESEAQVDPWGAHLSEAHPGGGACVGAHLSAKKSIYLFFLGTFDRCAPPTPTCASDPLFPPPSGGSDAIRKVRCAPRAPHPLRSAVGAHLTSPDTPARAEAAGHQQHLPTPFRYSVGETIFPRHKRLEARDERDA